MNLKGFTDFRLRDKLSPGLFEHFAQIFREQAPNYLTLSTQSQAKKRNFTLSKLSFSSQSQAYVCYPYFSPVGYLTLFVLRFLSSPPNDNPKLELSALQHADIYDEDTRATTSYPVSYTHLRAHET